MKARILLVVLALALASACSAPSLPTGSDRPELGGGSGGTGTIGSGH